MKFGMLMQNNIPITVIWFKLKPKIEYPIWGTFFSKPEVVISQPWIELSRRHLVCW